MATARKRNLDESRRDIPDDKPPINRKKRRSVNTNTGSSDFHRALNALDDALSDLPKDTHNSGLFESGFRVYDAIRNITSNKSSISEEKLTEIVRSTTRIVAGNEAHPEGDEGYRNEIDNYYKFSNDVRRFPIGQVIAGAMSFLIGTAVVVASGIIAAVSFGLLAPLSIFGIAVGASMVVGGIATGIGALGAGAVMASGMLFFNAAQKDPLREAMKDVEASAREHYNFKKSSIF